MIGKKLRELRIHKGLTQRELGELIGVSASAVGMYEQGRRKPESEMIVKVCKFFGVSADWLLSDRSDVSGILLFDFVEQVKKQLFSQKGLMFDVTESGEARPLPDEEIELLFDAILIGVEVARKLNQAKYTPKKHRKA